MRRCHRCTCVTMKDASARLWISLGPDNALGREDRSLIEDSNFRPSSIKLATPRIQQIYPESSFNSTGKDMPANIYQPWVLDAGGPFSRQFAPAAGQYCIRSIPVQPDVAGLPRTTTQGKPPSPPPPSPPLPPTLILSNLHRSLLLPFASFSAPPLAFSPPSASAARCTPPLVLRRWCIFSAVTPF